MFELSLQYRYILLYLAFSHDTVLRFIFEVMHSSTLFI